MVEWRILQGNVTDRLSELPAASVQTCVTSPPYWGLRDYGTARWEGGDPACEHRGSVSRTAPPGTSKQASNDGGNDVRSGDCACGARRIDAQIGLEPTPSEYVTRMVEVFAEVHRVLREDGTLWLNLGDSYAATSKGSGGTESKQPTNAGSFYDAKFDLSRCNLKPKDLVGIPWMVAFALRDYGWYLRSDIIWSKPNPMPESVTDRPTKSHEQIFLFSKSARYYYDAEAIAEQSVGEPPISRMKLHGGLKAAKLQSLEASTLGTPANGTRNKRSVWTVATQPYPEAHFATYPEALIEPCILAGSKPGDLVLDPFTGSGTTGAVAIRHQRSFVGTELNPAYIELAKQRIGRVAPLFASEAV